jgi:indole-3-glycerol phosphate synthase
MDEANVKSALRVYNDTASVAAISILTDQDHFGGSLEELWQARRATDKPILRKDFILEEYQVLEARAFGADAVLIMSGLHASDPRKAAGLVSTAKSLGMDILFELGMTRDAVDAQRALMRDDDVVWGINSRRFETSRLRARSRIGTFFGSELSVSTGIHADLRRIVPDGQMPVAESGIRDPSYLHSLRELNYCAALIGTAFLKKGANLAEVVASFDREIARMVTQRQDASQPLSSRSPVPTG